MVLGESDVQRGPVPKEFYLPSGNGRWLGPNPITLRSLHTSTADGECFICDTVAELATRLGIPADVAEASVKRYNDNIDASGSDPDFGRNHILAANVKSPLTKVGTAPFYGFAVMPANFYTEAGLNIDPEGRVRDVWGETIPGLYATGLMANRGGKYPFGAPQTLIAIGGAMVWGYYSALNAAKMTDWEE